MASERAAKGGGREIAVSSPNYSVGATYGVSGAGSAWFGPGAPMSPQAPPEVEGRAFDFPQGVNLLTTTRAYEPITYGTLRAFADGYDLLRLIIETRKDAMERLSWNIQLRDSKARVSPQKRNQINSIIAFFQKPDRENNWQTWLRMLLEDLFVVDAVSLYRRRTRGGKLYSLEQVDGATVRRVLDDWGRTPEDPNATAYQQILKGMPAVNYTTKDLLFAPRNKRVHKIYGYSPVEQIMMTINIGLRRQIFQLNFFTDGNMPPALIGVPETWTPDQIRTFQEWFDNILAGNLAERRKARFVPSAVGKTYIPTQETELFGKAEEWLARVCCFAFSISPQPFLHMMNRATADVAEDSSTVNGLQPVMSWIKGLIDQILTEDFDAPDLEFIWKGDDEIDPDKRSQITTRYLNSGIITLNEARAAAGLEPYDDPIYDMPMFLTSNGLAPLVLTPDAQGGGQKFDEKGNPIKPSGSTGANSDKPSSDVKKLYDLIASGDQELLANHLRNMQGDDDE